MKRNLKKKKIQLLYFFFFFYLARFFKGDFKLYFKLLISKFYTCIYVGWGGYLHACHSCESWGTTGSSQFSLSSK